MNIHGAHSYWKQGALVAAGLVVYGLELGRSVRRTGAGAYRAASRTACYYCC